MNRRKREQERQRKQRVRSEGKEADQKHEASCCDKKLNSRISSAEGVCYWNVLWKPLST